MVNDRFGYGLWGMRRIWYRLDYIFRILISLNIVNSLMTFFICQTMQRFVNTHQLDLSITAVIEARITTILLGSFESHSSEQYPK